MEAKFLGIIASLLVRKSGPAFISSRSSRPKKTGTKSADTTRRRRARGTCLEGRLRFTTAIGMFSQILSCSTPWIDRIPRNLEGVGEAGEICFIYMMSGR